MPVPEHLTGGNKRPSHNTKLRIKHYINEVSKLLLKGYTPYEIGFKLRPNSKSNSWVYKCIKRIHQTLNKQIEDNADTYLRLMEAKYGRIEVEMWEAWESSKTDHKGNPRQPNVVFMDRILVALESLRKLRGMDKQIEKRQGNEPKENVLDWDSLTKRRQLSSVTVNVNNNTVNQATTHTSNVAIAPAVSPESPTERLKIELKKRMEELERRAIENEAAKHAALCEDDAASVPQPVIFLNPKATATSSSSDKDIAKKVPPKQAVKRIIIRPITKS